MPTAAEIARPDASQGQRGRRGLSAADGYARLPPRLGTRFGWARNTKSIITVAG